MRLDIQYRLTIIILLWTLSVLAVTASDNSTIGPRNQVYYKGDKAVLKCRVFNVESDFLEWADYFSNKGKFPNRIHLDKNGKNELNPRHGRYNVSAKAIGNGKKSDLVIAAVQPQDAGQYGCKRVLQDVNYSTGELVVIDEFMVTTNTTSAGFKEGDRARLNCTAKRSGALAPTLRWYKAPGGPPLASTTSVTDLGKYSSVIHMYLTKTDDKSEYVCKMAFNSSTNVTFPSGMKLSRSTGPINVLYSPRNLMLSKKKTGYYAGDQVLCRAEGNPAPTVDWDTSTITDPVLKITKDMSGKSYTCTATNSLGSVNYTLQVSIGLMADCSDEKNNCSSASIPGLVCNVPNGTNQTHGQCICDTANNWTKAEQYCTKNVGIGDTCSKYLLCPKHTSCTGQICKCDVGFIQIGHSGTPELVCARRLNSTIDPNCTRCDANTGICYDTNKDASMDGCKCPFHRYGENCGIIRESKIDEVCVISSPNCTASVRGLVCRGNASVNPNGTCLCDSGKGWIKENTTCFRNVAYGETCDTVLRCPVNTTCLVGGLGGVSHCLCSPGFARTTAVGNGKTQCLRYGVDIFGAGDMCTTNAQCPSHSKCRYDVDTSTSRCKCDESYIKVTLPGTTMPVCVKEIKTGKDGQCKQCRENDGKCWTLAGVREKSGCLCPVYRSGNACQNIHVNVTCSISKFMMHICYQPHDGVNLTSTAVMFIKGKSHVPACQGKRNNSTCPGMYSIDLSLKKEDIATCGIREKPGGTPHTTRYYVHVIVQKKAQRHIEAEDIAFGTYCQYDTASKKTIAGYNPFEDVAGARGFHHKAVVTMFMVNDKTMQPIKSGSNLLMTDKFRMQYDLKMDGAYSSIKVQTCVASNANADPQDRKSSIVLISDGCPAAGQKHITSANFPKRVPLPVEKKDFRLRSGPIEVFKFQTGDEVQIKCLLLLCLTGKEAKCAQESCSSSGAKSRARRAMAEFEEDNVNLKTSYTVSDPEEEEFSSPAAMIGLVVALSSLLILTVAVIVMVLLKRRRMKREQANRDRMNLAFTNYCVSRSDSTPAKSTS